MRLFSLFVLLLVLLPLAGCACGTGWTPPDVVARFPIAVAPGNMATGVSYGQPMTVMSPLVAQPPPAGCFPVQLPCAPAAPPAGTPCP